jgi:hypothetical protein
MITRLLQSLGPVYCEYDPISEAYMVYTWLAYFALTLRRAWRQFKLRIGLPYGLLGAVTILAILTLPLCASSRSPRRHKPQSHRQHSARRR